MCVTCIYLIPWDIISCSTTGSLEPLTHTNTVFTYPSVKRGPKGKLIILNIIIHRNCFPSLSAWCEQPLYLSYIPSLTYKLAFSIFAFCDVNHYIRFIVVVLPLYSNFYTFSYPFRFVLMSESRWGSDQVTDLAIKEYFIYLLPWETVLWVITSVLQSQLWNWLSDQLFLSLWKRGIMYENDCTSITSWLSDLKSTVMPHRSKTADICSTDYGPYY